MYVIQMFLGDAYGRFMSIIHRDGISLFRLSFSLGDRVKNPLRANHVWLVSHLGCQEPMRLRSAQPLGSHDMSTLGGYHARRD